MSWIWERKNTFLSCKTKVTKRAGPRRCASCVSVIPNVLEKSVSLINYTTSAGTKLARVQSRPVCQSNCTSTETPDCWASYDVHQARMGKNSSFSTSFGVSHQFEHELFGLCAEFNWVKAKKDLQITRSCFYSRFAQRPNSLGTWLVRHVTSVMWHKIRTLQDLTYRCEFVSLFCTFYFQTK